MGSLPPNVAGDETFWSRVEKTDRCWLWTGSRSPGGYGRYGVFYAHRLAYQAAYGAIAPKLHVDHLCHTPPCVNPDHLMAVTCSENLQNRAGVPTNSTSGARGVSFFKPAGLWRIYATVDGKRHWGGYFKELRDAEVAVVELRNRVMTHNLSDRESA